MFPQIRRYAMRDSWIMVEQKSAPKSVSQGQKPLLRVRFDSERWVCVDPDAVDGASTTDSHWKRFARFIPAYICRARTADGVC